MDSIELGMMIALIFVYVSFVGMASFGLAIWLADTKGGRLATFIFSFVAITSLLIDIKYIFLVIVLGFLGLIFLAPIVIVLSVIPAMLNFLGPVWFIILIILLFMLRRLK